MSPLLASSLFSARIGTLPKANTIEVTVLGPGYGEAIVVHLPGVGWGVIDSCVFKQNSLPLHYLQALGVSSLNFVFLSHPHQDHYNGLDEVINAFQSIEMVGRYNGNSIPELKRYWQRQDIANGTSVNDALARVFNSMRAAEKRGAKNVKLSEMVTIERSGVIGSEPYTTKMVVLSPSGKSEELYADALRRCLPRVGKRMKVLPDSDYNLIGSAIWVQSNSVKIVFGSDVEKGRQNQTGWKGIVSSPTCPDLIVNAIKVAHHGSSDAHHQPAWSKHRMGSPVAMITPFVRGNKALPGHGDYLRIKEHSQHVGITGKIEFEDASQHYQRSVAGQTVYDFRTWHVCKTPAEAGLLRVRYDLHGNLIERFALAPSQWLC